MTRAQRHKKLMTRRLCQVSLALALCVAGFLVPQVHAQSEDEYARDPYNPIIARDAWLLIGRTEQSNGIPPGLLHAMALTETGQGIRGWMLPWPYTVGINSTGKRDYLKGQHALNDLAWMRKVGYVRYDVRAGTQVLAKVTYDQAVALINSRPNEGLYRLEPYPFGRRFNNVNEAEKFVYSRFALGHRNMDIGMMQINWRVHGQHFSSVREALEPNRNVQYAVTYLLEHRQSPKFGRDWWTSVGRYHSATPRYAKKYILNVWNMYQRIHRLKA